MRWRSPRCLVLALSACATPASGTGGGGGEGGDAAVRRARLEGLPAPVLAGREGGRRAGGRGVRRRASPSTGPAPRPTSTQQIQMLQTALDKQPDGDRLRRARQPGGRRRCCSRPRTPTSRSSRSTPGVDSDIPVTTAATDNIAAAAEAAKHMAEADRPRGQGRHRRARPDQRHRRRSAATASSTTWRTNEPNIEIVDIQYGGGDQAKSADIAKAIIAANPDLKGIYGSNEGSAIGVVQAREGARHRPGSSPSSASTPARPRSTPSTSGLMTRRDHPEPGRHRLRDGGGRGRGDQGRGPAEDIDTGFYWYDKTQHRRRRDRRPCCTSEGRSGRPG